MIIMLWIAMKTQLKKMLRHVRKQECRVIARFTNISSLEVALAHAKDADDFGTQLANLLEHRPEIALNVLNERVKAYLHLAHLGNLVRQFDINFVIDAGAHSGQFASTLYGYGGYKGEIHSFEPVKKYYDVLAGWLYYYPGWKAYNAALGDVPGSSVIYLGKGHGGTSSLLNQTDNLQHFAPDCALEGTQEIMVHRVDELFGEVIDNPDKRVFLKLDVQGFENRVLASCGDHLSQIKMLQVEMSAITFYKNQSSLGQLCSDLENAGFAPVQISNNFGVRQSIYLDYDFIFVRRQELEKIGLNP